MAIKSERIFVVGASGQGKSHFVLWLVEDRYVFKKNRRFILCDYTNEYTSLSLHPNVYLIRVDRKHLGKLNWTELIKKYKKIVVSFHHELSIPEINNEIIRISKSCMLTGDVQFILDEAQNLIPIASPFLSRGELAEHLREIRRLCSQGRKIKVGYVMVSQRIAMLDKTPLTQANELFIFRMHAPQDLEAISPYVADAEVISSLPNYHCYHYTISGVKEILKPVKPSVPHLG